MANNGYDWLHFSEQTSTDHQNNHENQTTTNPFHFSPSSSSDHHHQQQQQHQTTTYHHLPYDPSKSTVAPSKPIRRRSRASKKTPVTTLNASASNFRALVQRFTGCPSPTVPVPLQVRDGPVNLNFGGLGNNNGDYQQSFPEITTTVTPQPSVLHHEYQHQVLYDREDALRNCYDDSGVMYSSGSGSHLVHHQNKWGMSFDDDVDDVDFTTSKNSFQR